MNKRILSFILASIACSNTFAVLLVNESFSYTPGGLNGQNGGTGFVSSWTGSNVPVTGSELNHPARLPANPVSPPGSLLIGGTDIHLSANRNYNASVQNALNSPDDVWFSFITNRAALGPNLASTTFKFGPGQFDSISFRVSISNNIQVKAGNKTQNFAVPVANSMIVAKVSGDTNGLWDLTLFAPTVPGDMTVYGTINDFGFNSTGTNNLFLGYDNFSAPTTYTMDEIRIGTEFTDVALIPEPATIASMIIGSVALMRRKIKKI